ncbi:MAG: SpoIID/LytB domain-containing protein [Chitinivibrionales bacterium]|nr:SpoIID/LytB domain-containing protein [Chitinivibrionales bacterium]
MITKEPLLTVGIVEQVGSITGVFDKPFLLPDNTAVAGSFRAEVVDGAIAFRVEQGGPVMKKAELFFTASPGGSFSIHEVMIGIQFHWQRTETQRFHGNCRLILNNGLITVINQVPLEVYLRSVIASEMSATAPLELLKAHAITSRSWLVAMLMAKGKEESIPTTSIEAVDGTKTRIIRWYGRQDHEQFDVCADDHCQRYHGISRIISDSVNTAIEQTRGTFLVHGDQICDSRYAKSCGGRTELFANAWQNADIPYLKSVFDTEDEHMTLDCTSEDWYRSRPEAYCNTTDASVLKMVLPSFDQETADFFRWQVRYTPNELTTLVKTKSGFDIGRVTALQPLEHGPSGRITLLRIIGSLKTIDVGKELEIRRWLAKTHLYSSAFFVETITAADGSITEFILHGAGWGHGVGLCQIGAAVMAVKGKSAEEILHHYFNEVQLMRLY